MKLPPDWLCSNLIRVEGLQVSFKNRVDQSMPYLLTLINVVTSELHFSVAKSNRKGSHPKRRKTNLDTHRFKDLERLSIESSKR